ncbi:hypothetical protein ASA1KI_37040 [Opitutales bacterium ASA1]|uniref:hypothetical protein n=1 Tax=Congregicoccus parvus TaxID=3081749 RepID=UPI002B2BA208|nr:hypothetical protein ASA1KI_37040 [Opitutales bacterium ASA1]
MTLLVQIGLWLVRKFGVALLIGAVVLVVGALVLYLRENLRTEAERMALVERLEAQAAQLEASLAEFDAQLAAVAEEIETQRARAITAQRILESVAQMNSFWDWLFGARVDPAELERRNAKAAADNAAATSAIESLGARLGAIGRSREDAVAELERTRLELERSEMHASPVVQYLRRAWATYRWPLAGALALYFFGPTLWKLFAFYAVAPLVARARPIVLRREPIPEIGTTPSRVSESVALRPGESLFVREKFLQASDESLRRRTRFVLDWSIPLTCAATGLIELVELAHPATTDGTAAATVSTQEDATIELSVVDVPEGSGLVLRPSFLAGLVLPEGSRLRVKRHWRLFHLQSWITMQFRFFEFRGPCRLVVAGSRGVRAETLAGGAEGEGRARRTNQDATIGFTPDLAYRSVRAETFWSYYRDRNPLFDDVFHGAGTFLCQEIPTGTHGASVRRFWSSLWNGFLKVFGL